MGQDSGTRFVVLVLLKLLGDSNVCQMDSSLSCKLRLMQVEKFYGTSAVLIWPTFKNIVNQLPTFQN